MEQFKGTTKSVVVANWHLMVRHCHRKSSIRDDLTFFLPLLGAEALVEVVVLTWSAGRDSGTGCSVGVLMLWGWTADIARAAAGHPRVFCLQPRKHCPGVQDVRINRTFRSAEAHCLFRSPVRIPPVLRGNKERNNWHWTWMKPSKKIFSETWKWKKRGNKILRINIKVL